LTDYENHRTDTEYEDALIAKTFVVQFFNCYTPLFYIAFVKPFIPTIDYCVGGDCMAELQVFLGAIFLSRLVLNNFLEVVIPAIMVGRNRSKQENYKKVDRTDIDGLSAKDRAAAEGLLANDSRHAEDVKRDLTTMGDVEKNYILNDYNVMLGVFSDYSELAIQFGYTTMFVAAFPLCVLIAALNNYVEIRVDAWKLTQLTRRPEPRGCEDIGVWYGVMSFISGIAVVTNCGISVYTGTQMVDYTWAERSYIFVGFCGAVFVGKAVLSYIIYLTYITIWLDTDHVVSIQVSRQEYVEKKVVLNFKDDAEFDMALGSQRPNYIVGETDDDPL
jgi:hypothetical protein